MELLNIFVIYICCFHTLPVHDFHFGFKIFMYLSERESSSELTGSPSRGLQWPESRQAEGESLELSLNLHLSQVASSLGHCCCLLESAGDWSQRSELTLNPQPVTCIIQASDRLPNHWAKRPPLHWPLAEECLATKETNALTEGTSKVLILEKQN